MVAQGPVDHGGHQLVTEFDPHRPDWCFAECRCGAWYFESIAPPDPDTHVILASVRAELEWRKHIPPGAAPFRDYGVNR